MNRINRIGFIDRAASEQKTWRALSHTGTIGEKRMPTRGTQSPDEEASDV